MKKTIKKKKIIKTKNTYQVTIKQVTGKPHRIYKNLFLSWVPTEEQFNELTKLLKI